MHVDQRKGLSDRELQERIKKYGFNEIPEREEALFQRILRRFWGPIPWMIEAAALLSALVQEWADFTIITILLLVNVIIDFRQEAQALNALKVLKQKLARKALVLRNGDWQFIDSRQLVPGDIIKIKLGNIVPADAMLLEGKYLQIDQSALTGESLPVERSPGQTVYANSIVRTGEMIAVVTGTGLQTYFGKTVALVAKAEKEQKSHFQKAVINVGNYLILLAAAMVVLIIFAGILRHDSLMEILRFSLVLTVASIPVALPAVLSVTMAVGAVRLARRQAVVSRLEAIEELAGVDVLCCDKTGTLTKNQMVLETPLVFSGFTEDQALLFSALASRQEDDDPLEQPIFEKLERLGRIDELKEWTQLDFTPFDPVRKRSDAKIQRNNESLEVTKGAPQAVLSMCDESELKGEVTKNVFSLAQRGYRTLGIAVKRSDQDKYQFIALLPFYDPPREDSLQTLSAARDLGVKIKMLTGDNIAIAKRIAQMLGISGGIRNVEELKSQSVKLEESKITSTIEKAGGFAQVFPEDKYFIVDHLQHQRHIVGMTGDGVNDAPALKKSDAGIAVSGATDAARAAADLVLLQPGLSVIINAIEEARMIFGRMKSYAIFRIAETIRIILFMTLAITAFNFYPVTALMIIILALLNDMPIMAIAFDNAKVERKPVRWDMREVLTVATVLGLLGVISSFLVFFALEELHFSRDLMQAIIFLKLAVAGHSTIYVARTGAHHFWHKPYPSLKLFIPAFTTQIIGTLIACYGIFMAPIGWKYTIYIWVYATVWFVFNDFAKIGVYRLLRRRQRFLKKTTVHTGDL